MRVGDLIRLRQEVYSIREGTTVHDAARHLRNHKARSVGVREAERLVGVISQNDIPCKVAAENEYLAWVRVSEIRSRDLLVVVPEFPLTECQRLMGKRGVFHLRVEEVSGHFLGLILVAEILQFIASDHKAYADRSEAFAFPQK